MSRVTIVGVLGKFGAVLAEKFLNSGYSVSGIDIAPIADREPPPSLTQYYQAAAPTFSRLSNEIKRLIESTDILLLATPAESIGAAVAAYGEHLPAHALLVDIASVKTPAVASMHSLDRNDIELLSIHPLFGPATAFAGENVAVIELRSGSYTKALLELFESWGCRLIKLTSAEHDHAMAFVQSLCHALVIALGQTGKAHGLPTSLASLNTPFSRELFRLLNRIANTDPRLYTSLQITNPYTLTILDLYLSQLQRFRTLVANNDQAALHEFIASSVSLLEP